MRIAAFLALGLIGCAADGGAVVTPGDAMGTFDATADGLCPPKAPFGIAEGDRISNPRLTDCSGTPYSLHALCEKKAAYQFHLAGW